MQKTVVVEVARAKLHRLYGKVIRYSTKYMAHDESDALQIGDQVQIVESRPLSRHKRWVVEKVLTAPGSGQVGSSPQASHLGDSSPAQGENEQ
jgi:small subunit ribosomal protein S17